MEHATPNPAAGVRATFLAGLQAGMMAVLVMLGWLGVSARWQQHTFWSAPNQMATVFHGGAAISGGFAATTPSGIALYVLSYSLLGALFAMARPRKLTGYGTILAGVLLSVGWYWLWFRVLGRSLMPLVWMLHAERPMAFAHVLYGVLLARYPAYLKPFSDGRGSECEEAVNAAQT